MHTQKTIKIKNIISSCSRIQDQIQRCISQDSLEGEIILCDQPPFLKIFESIRKRADHIAQNIDYQGGTAADLPVRSRRAYQWLTFLMDPDHFQAHVQTLLKFSEIEDQFPPPVRYPGKRITLNLFLIGPLYRIRRQRGTIRITAHESFIVAQPQVLRSLIQVALPHDEKRAKEAIHKFTNSAPYLEMRERMEYIAIPRQATTKGTHKDLLPVFHQVNQTYFNGSLSQPHLVWSERSTYRKFGHYQYETDTILISRSLDDPQLPDHTLAYVMYHELLHKELGSKQINGRRYSHTQAFREKEKMFKEYKKAQSILEHLSQQLS